MKSKVLLIDDDTALLEETQNLLQDADYAAGICAQSQNALQMIESFKPDCVLLDIHMPGMDGEDLLLVIRKKYPALPVIICTGMTDLDERYLLKSGACEILHKPFFHTTLFTAIERAVSQDDETMPIMLKGYNLKEIRDTILRKVIIKALSRTNFNITHSAELLGISRQCLLRYITRLQIHY